MIRLTPPARGAFTLHVRSFAVLALALLSAGCLTVSGASSNAIPAVRVQASSDLDCPQNELHVVKEWGGRFSVVGCGQKRTYNTGCEGLRCSVAPEGQAIPWRSRPDPTPTP